MRFSGHQQQAVKRRPHLPLTSTVALANPRAELSLRTSGRAAVVSHFHAHLGQQIVQCALLIAGFHDLVERYQVVRILPGNLHIAKDIPLGVQYCASHKIVADGHWAEVVDSHEPLV